MTLEELEAMFTDPIATFVCDTNDACTQDREDAVAQDFRKIELSSDGWGLGGKPRSQSFDQVWGQAVDESGLDDELIRTLTAKGKRLR